MAVGANFHMNVPDCGARFDDLSAGANNLGRFILRMDSWLHKILSMDDFYNTMTTVLQLAHDRVLTMDHDIGRLQANNATLGKLIRLDCQIAH
jgi:hypothetical protein